MLVLDTDVLTIVQSQSGGAFDRLQKRLTDVGHKEVVAVTIVTVEEQTRGWLAQFARVRTAEQEVIAYRRLRYLIADYCAREVLDYDKAAIERLREQRKSKIRIGTMDLKIACIVQARGAKLLSRNLVDFRKVSGLSVEDWTLP
jgi:tRNA(fMet)-specific endonuclease VapC